MIFVGEELDFFMRALVIVLDSLRMLRLMVMRLSAGFSRTIWQLGWCRHS
jgi:hypothetical protein